MAPTIMIIRHGEGGPHFPADCVNEDGARKDNDLAVAGWRRSGALAQFFRAPPAPLVPPQRLFSPAATHDHPSKRSKHTLASLADLLGVEIDQSCDVKDAEGLARAVLRSRTPALIAWRHSDIKAVAEQLADGEFVAPSWPDDRFDMVFLLRREREWTLTQVPQLLFAGDRSRKFH